MPDVLTAGEALAAFRLPPTLSTGSSASVSIAGAESNVAIGLSRLGHSASMLGVVGDDAFGRLVERTLRAEGVVSRLRRAPEPTGIIAFTHRLPGVVHVDYHRAHSAGATLSADDVSEDLVREHRLVHLTGITPALSPAARDAALRLAQLAKANGLLLSIDVNYRSKLWAREQAGPVIGHLASVADVVIASDDELELAAPSGTTDPIAALLSTGTEVVVKRGARGASVYTAEGSIDAPAVPVTAVDAIGAGDAFSAGYLSALLEGLDTAARLTRACAVGAFAVATDGDWEGLPRRTELPLIRVESGSALR